MGSGCKVFMGVIHGLRIHSGFYIATCAHGPTTSQVRPKGEILLRHIFRHILSHLVTHHVTSYFVYYFLQVLFRGLPPFRTMSPFIFVYVFLAFPSLYLSSHSVPSHCCLPWLHLSFLRALVTWLHFRVTVDTILPHSSITVYKG